MSLPQKTPRDDEGVVLNIIFDNQYYQKTNAPPINNTDETDVILNNRLTNQPTNPPTDEKHKFPAPGTSL